jgi:hypothetical protein
VSKLISAPVGIRFKVHNVANFQKDQQTVSDLLFKIPMQYGGKGPPRPNAPGRWRVAVLAGPNKSCPKEIADAIWEFQVHWKNKGVFKNIDGVADPDGNTIKLMEKLVGAPPHPLDPFPKPGIPVTPVAPETPKPKVILTNPRIGGSWQITSVTSFAIGEVGMLGYLKLQITQPDGKVFEAKAYGAGFGVSVDPVSLAKWIKGVAPFTEPATKIAMAQLASMLAKGVGFNIGDYLQTFGISLTQMTRGQIIANPINQYIGKPRVPSRYGLVGGVGGAQMLMISVGAGIGFGVEGGVVLMGPQANSGLLAEYVGCYGLGGLTAKVGGGATGMLYNIYSDIDV